MKYAYLFDAAWLLLAGWSLALLAVGFMTFNEELQHFLTRERTIPDKRG
jgi:hypothetical protein